MSEPTQEDAVVEAVVAFLATYDQCEDAIRGRVFLPAESRHHIQRPYLRERIGGPPRSYLCLQGHGRNGGQGEHFCSPKRRAHYP